MRWLGQEPLISPTFPFASRRPFNTVSKQGLCQALKRWRFSEILAFSELETLPRESLRHSANYASCSGRADLHTNAGRLTESAVPLQFAEGSGVVHRKL